MSVFSRMSRARFTRVFSPPESESNGCARIRVVQRSIDFTSGQAEFYSGNYSFYVVERQRRFDEQLKKYEKDQAKLQQLTEAAAKLHLWAFMGNDKLHKRAFSIEKRMEKLETTERPTEARKLNVHFTAQEFRGDDVLTMAGLGKRHGAVHLHS